MSHSHVLYDADPHFKIDPISRKITNESSTKTTIIQHDHNSERFTFSMPRYVEGVDISLCNIVEVHYVNIEANTKIVRAGVYTIDDLHVKDDDENTVVCSWVVAKNATQFIGQLQFLIRFSCTHGESGTIDYVWNTAVYSGITISQGIYNGDIPSDTPLRPYNFVTTINGDILRFFVGTKAEYDALDYTEKQGLFAIITDDESKTKIEGDIQDLKTFVNNLLEGNISMPDSQKLDGLPKSYFRGHGTGFTYLAEGERTDLNTLTREGHYFIVTGGQNTPSGCSHGFLDVDYFNGVGFGLHGIWEEVIKQTFRDYSSPATFVRTYRYDTTINKYAWTDWASWELVGSRKVTKYITEVALTCGWGDCYFSFVSYDKIEKSTYSVIKSAFMNAYASHIEHLIPASGINDPYWFKGVYRTSSGELHAKALLLTIGEQHDKIIKHPIQYEEVDLNFDSEGISRPIVIYCHQFAIE